MVKKSQILHITYELWKKYKETLNIAGQQWLAQDINLIPELNKQVGKTEFKVSSGLQSKFQNSKGYREIVTKGNTWETKNKNNKKNLSSKYTVTVPR